MAETASRYIMLSMALVAIAMISFAFVPSEVAYAEGMCGEKEKGGDHDDPQESTNLKSDDKSNGKPYDGFS